MFCLRNFYFLTSFAPRKERGKPKPKVRSPNPVLQQRLAKLAELSGFRSSTITAWLQHGHHDSLRRSLQEDLDIGLGASAGLAISLSRAPPRGVEPNVVQLFGDHVFGVERRSGRPFEDDYTEDRMSYFLLSVIGLDCSGVPRPGFVDPGERADINSMFCRRDLIKSFFGSGELKLPEPNPDSINGDVLGVVMDVDHPDQSSEREVAMARVQNFEQQLAEANSKVAESRTEIGALQSSLQRYQAEIAGLQTSQARERGIQQQRDAEHETEVANLKSRIEQEASAKLRECQERENL